MRALPARLLLPLLLPALAGPAFAAEPPRDVQGEWWTPGFNARVRIEACGDGGAVCGRIVWLWDDKPQGIADTTPLVGKPVIEQMRPAEPGRWAGGRLYNPGDGRDYKGSLQLRSASTLVVSGCVLFVCQTQVWRRAEPARCPPVAPP
ncbi:MAG: DUF2147 domain-containing protein [Rubrivivax sp.]|nr:DUF2147 domain-containing protein [Rubrivivax sp.]